MSSIFIGGSRGVSRINDLIRKRILNIIKKEFSVLVGDANGADKAVQKYLHEHSYPNVTVYCSGSKCRNNIGEWKINNVEVTGKVKGREFYMVKDAKMSQDCNYAFMLWDGKSAGTANNMLNMLQAQKNILVYFSPTKDFYEVKNMTSFQRLLDKCNDDELDNIDIKIKLFKRIQEIIVPHVEQIEFKM